MTATAPGHSTLLAGVSASLHGIIANEWFDPADGRVVSSVADPAAPLVGAADSPIRLPGGVADTDPTASPARLLAATVGDQLKAAFGDDSRVIGLANKDRGGIFLSGRRADAVYWMHLGRIVTSRYYRPTLPDWVEAFNATNPINSRYGQTWARLLPREFYDRVQGPDDMPEVLARHGLGVTRSFCFWPDFVPEPEVLDETVAERFADFLDAHVEAGLGTIPTLVVGHMSGENWDPAWRQGRDLHRDVWMVSQQAWFAAEIARRFGDHPAICGWLVSNEMPLYGGAASIEEIVRASAEEAADLDVAVALSCSCAGTDSSCTTSCGSGAAPSVFVSLSAERDFSGLLISNLSLRSESRVQIR